MSRIAGVAPLLLTRGTTWIDEFTYTDADGVAIDLTGYEAQLQVWDIDDEFSAAATPLLELLTTGGSPGLAWATAAGGRLTIPGLAADLHAALNPDNEAQVKYAYAVQVFIPGGVVIPLARGKLTVYGWGIH